VFQPAIQIIETARDEAEASVMLTALRLQVDHLASRILQPTYYEPLRIQAIMKTNGEYPDGWLPDGCKHVLWRGTL
jgi:hypothetical protein